MTPSNQQKNQPTKASSPRSVAWMVWCVLATAAFALVLGVIDFLFFNVLISEYDRITLTKLVAGIGAFISLFFFSLRLLQQDRRDVDEKFHAAIALLGNNETSARTGALYSLYHLAIESKKYRVQVAEILCSHIRSKTEEKEYREKHTERPSNEIQTAINVLFRGTGQKQGLYAQFPLPQANLYRTYLVGAKFVEAHCQEVNFQQATLSWADFRRANCERADFQRATCSKVNFLKTGCQKADFTYAHCEGADFVVANCQGGSLGHAYFSGASFEGAQCQGTFFGHSRLQGARFTNAHCQVADFSNADCRGAMFCNAHCQGADFSGCNCKCQGADFQHARCQGADFVGAQLEGARASLKEGHIFVFERDSPFLQGWHINRISTFLLSDRIGKVTKLNSMILLGKLDDGEIKTLKAAEKFLSPEQREQIQKIINENKGREITHACPVDIITGVLEDSDELQEILKQLAEIDKELAEFSKKNDGHPLIRP